MFYVFADGQAHYFENVSKRDAFLKKGEDVKTKPKRKTKKK